MSLHIKNKKLFFSGIVLILFHVIGILGIHSSHRELFISLSSLNLLLSAVLLIINHPKPNIHFWFFLLISALLGFIVEVIGVKTGAIFGNYQYGKSLGLKLLDVPLIIAINWFMLVYSVGCICEKLPINIIFKSLIGGIMLVLLDFLIELAAIQLDFWSWENGIIPIKNYIAWFLISFILLLIFNKFNFDKNNLLAKTLYIVQLVFFALINIF